jgi:hypothetical protein
MVRALASDFAAAILIKWGHIGKWCKIEGNLVWPIWPGPGQATAGSKN